MRISVKQIIVGCLVILIASFSSCSFSHPKPESRGKQKLEEKTQSNHGLPEPKVVLGGESLVIPFSIDSSFPTPVVEVMVNGMGPYKFVVDTGMSGAFLMRENRIKELDVPIIGYAQVGDASSKGMKKMPLVMINEARMGGMIINDIVTVAMEPSRAHASSIPDDLDGILGMQVFREFLLTIDYPAQEIRVIGLEDAAATDEEYIAFNYDNNAIEIPLILNDKKIPFIVDSGHRGTLTMPKSFSKSLALSEDLHPLGKVSTVTNTYKREWSRLNSSAHIAGYDLVTPPVVFADEFSPKLIGYGILKYFSISINQRSKRISFSRKSSEPIQNVELHMEQH